MNVFIPVGTSNSYKAGAQQDAHELMRELLGAMEKEYLHRFNHIKQVSEIVIISDFLFLHRT